jgi:hypothetical protein
MSHKPYKVRWPAPFSPDLPAEGEPDDECYSKDGQNDGYERTSAPCRRAPLGYRDTVVSMGHLCPSCHLVVLQSVGPWFGIPEAGGRTARRCD